MENLGWKKTKVGSLDERIEIQAVTETANNYGEPAKSWATVATLFTKVEYSTTGQNETYAEATIREYRPVIFTVRYRTDYSAKNRILYGGEVYDIENVEHEGRKRFTKYITVLRK